MGRAIIGLSDGLDRLCRSGAVACFAAMLVFVAIQVVARYVFRAPPVWTEELARFAMIWGGLLGAAAAFKGGHDPVLIKPPPGDTAAVAGTKRILRGAAVLIFLGPVLYYSLFGPGLDPARGFLGRSALRTADTLGFPMIYVALAVPVAAFVIFVHLAAQFSGGRGTAGAGGQPTDAEPG